MAFITRQMSIGDGKSMANTEFYIVVKNAIFRRMYNTAFGTSFEFIYNHFRFCKQICRNDAMAKLKQYPVKWRVRV